MKISLRRLTQMTTGLLLAALVAPLATLAASHAEAPLISMDRYADNTDTYAFRSLEPGREGFITLIANYIPLQEPSGGPQWFRFDDSVLYEIKIDNNGDGREDVTYQFFFDTRTVNGNTVLGQSTVNEDGVIGSLTDPDYNMPQTYKVRRVDRWSGRFGRQIGTGIVPPANIGPRVTPNYEANLGQPAISNLSDGGKVFAGNRDEYFYIDLGVFDALNLSSIGMSGGIDSTQNYNVSAIAIEVPVQDLTRDRRVPVNPTDDNAVIGVWATASRKSIRILGRGNSFDFGAYQQVSRLGNPLVNEVVVPLNFKDSFNALEPTGDAVLAPAVVDPELARLLQAVYGIAIPPPPRNDLVSIFATGIPVNAITGPNYTTFLSNGTPHEYLRLNTAIPITPIANQNRLGLLGGDVAGFPNGRRVFDDVTDIALRAVAGGTPFTPATNVAPNNALGDGVSFNPEGPLLMRFPYLRPPNQGNQPRTSNQQFSSAALRNEYKTGKKIPVVDSFGLLVR
ncbi:MAG: DUF4331 domain-containing protein [Pyrinomonadaceae bacterium]